MIASLRGSISDIAPGAVTLQVGPVALELLVPESFLGHLSRGEQVTIATHLALSDAGAALYGFRTPADRDFFRQLLTVTGVGPKSALAILAIDPQKVRSAIHAKDLATLSTIPGLGTKRAQRLILELGNALADAPADGKKRGKKSPAHPLAEILAPPLEKLGFTKEEISSMLTSLPEEYATPEAALQYLLKHAR